MGLLNIFKKGNKSKVVVKTVPGGGVPKRIRAVIGVTGILGIIAVIEAATGWQLPAEIRHDVAELILNVIDIVVAMLGG